MDDGRSHDPSIFLVYKLTMHIHRNLFRTSSATSIKTLCPVSSTWIKAIDAGFFATWHGLTSDLVRKDLLRSISTSKGYMRKTKTNIRSTKPKPIPPPSISTNNLPVEMTTPHVRESEALFHPLQITGKIAIEQMGCFPKTSSNRTKYVMACYIHDTNGILTESFKSREDKELSKAFTSIYNSLVNHGLTLPSNS